MSPSKSILGSKELNSSVQEIISDVLESMGDGFFILDKDLTITHANKIFEQFANVKRKDVIGKNLWRAFPHVAYPDSPYKINYQKVIDTGESTCFIVQNTRKEWMEIGAY